MAAARKIFWNWVSNTIQISDKSKALLPDGFWEFCKYSLIPWQIVVIEPASPYGPNDFSRLDITDLALKMTVDSVLDTSAPKVEQATWTKDTTSGQMTFTGSLNLNTAGFNTYVGSSDSLTPYFQLELSGANMLAKYRRTITVRQSVTPPTTVGPDPAQRYLTADEIEGIYVRRVLGPGESITFQDGSGTNLRVIGVRQDGSPQDDAYS